MKSSQLITHLLTGAIGLALGLSLAPPIRTTEANDSESPAGKLRTAGSGSKDAEVEPNTAQRTRTRNREEATINREPRVSIPLKSIVEILKKGEFNYSSQFDRLHYSMTKALILLGATATEQEEVVKLVKATQSEVLAAEKQYVKLGEVTAHSIQMDMSGMRGPAEEIAGRTKDGIRASLPMDLAEGLISAIDWDEFYPTDAQAFTRLEVTRSRSGALTQWERKDRGSTGGSLNPEFKDDGTPLPADQVFGKRWKPFLKGLTILPKDQE